MSEFTATAAAHWVETNRRHWADALRWLRARLGGERHVTDEIPSIPALDALASLFGLSPFEKATLLLCASVELDGRFAALCADASGDVSRRQPTFSVALASLPEPHWTSLDMEAPLRRWRLIELGSGDGLTTAPLRIDEAVLRYLIEATFWDGALTGIVDLVRECDELTPSEAAVARCVTQAWTGPLSRLPLAVLCGGTPQSRLAVSRRVTSSLKVDLARISANSLPADPRDLAAFIRQWERQAALGQVVLFVDAHDLAEDHPRRRATLQFLESTQAAMMIGAREPLRPTGRPALAFDLPPHSAAEQRELWEKHLGDAAPRFAAALPEIVSQFRLPASAIRTGALQAKTRAAGRVDPRALLIEICRAHARTPVHGLAQPVRTSARWPDLVVGDAQSRTLREIVDHVRHRATVYESWGFAEKTSRGLGISALFAGPSGTGKTLAAEVLANELSLDLYRIDLASVVSKYIGETEKNLATLFDAAEQSSAILVFDEADALFGKRTEVRDSHDRYSNLEVSYLLQRMEAYRGLAILTTNLKEAIDPAFLRRIRFLVAFPFPDAAQRAEIWRRVFPPSTPIEGIDFHRLAVLNLSGGSIHNIAMHAAFFAAAERSPVRPRHLAEAARGELRKLEQPVPDLEALLCA